MQCNWFNVPKEIPLVFDKVSNYDYHFIIKELENEFEKKYKTFDRKRN